MTKEEDGLSKQEASDRLMADLEEVMSRYNVNAPRLEEILDLPRGYISRVRSGSRIFGSPFLLRYGLYICDEVLRGRLASSPPRPRWLSRKSG